MKIERTKRRGKGELTLEITPLIDVVFLLLIFFLVATTFEDINSGIKIELPQSTIREIKDIKEIQIAIDKNKKEGRLVIEDNFLKATKEGLYVLNDILVDFMK